MSAPAIIDVNPERLTKSAARTTITDASNGYQEVAADPSLTDAERLTRFQKNTTLTVDASKGLSKLQRQILGVAYTMHVYGTQEHGGKIPDYVTPLGVFVIFRIAPNLAGSNARFSRTPQIASAKAALSRAATRLVERKLIFYRDHEYIRDRFGFAALGSVSGGYCLTDTGMRIGASEPVPVPHIERCARYFGMVGLYRWHRDASGIWIATPWDGGEGCGYHGLPMLDDCEVISRSIGSAP